MSGAKRNLKGCTHSGRIFADEHFEVTTVEFGNGSSPHPVRMFWILEDQDVVSWKGGSSLVLHNESQEGTQNLHCGVPTVW